MVEKNVTIVNKTGLHAKAGQWACESGKEICKQD